MLKTHEKIITAHDLAQNTLRALHHAQQEPLVVTEAGRPAAYLISVELFDTLLAQLEVGAQTELTSAIAQGEAQFAAGQFKTLAEATAILEAQWQQEHNGRLVEEEISEQEWLTSAARNPAFTFLADAAEDIYTVADGEPFHDPV